MSEATKQLFNFYNGTLLPDDLLDVMTNDQGWFPSGKVAVGTYRRDFSVRAAELPPLEIQDGGRTFDVYDYIATNAVSAMIILKDGVVVHEFYRRGLSSSTLWLSCSLAKSIAATLVGVALGEGKIRSLDDPVSRYCELRGAYADVSVKQLLRMCTGVRWNEDYGDATSDRRALLDVQLRAISGGIATVMQGLGTTAPPGSTWCYNTGESCLLGAVIQGATGTNLTDYLSDKIWSRFGMAQTASWWQETEGGITVSGTGLYAALGDYARFGQFILEEMSTTPSGIMPDNWQREASAPYRLNGSRIPYGYMWWVPDPIDPVLEGSFQAEGIYGQFLHINPNQRIVAMIACCRSKPSKKRRVEICDDAFFAALAKTLY
ncbi:serine hydrolase [Bosea sp. LjRoot9]|uniref:serine hydrolase domain-containing protein n=1 Tax=Bosea sp. LjRoot9 TaxID=3342341 RepID=UPI003ECFA27B